MPDLHYDVIERTVKYQPGERKGHWILILGRWIRVTVKNAGSQSATDYRVYVRGSVF